MSLCSGSFWHRSSYHHLHWSHRVENKSCREQILQLPAMDGCHKWSTCEQSYPHPFHRWRWRVTEGEVIATLGDSLPWKLSEMKQSCTYWFEHRCCKKSHYCALCNQTTSTRYRFICMDSWLSCRGWLEADTMQEAQRVAGWLVELPFMS